MSDDREQLRVAKAARDYFTRAWITEVRRLNRSSMSHEEATNAMGFALAWATAEMDGLEMEAELTDHCLHWCVLLRVPSLNHTEYYEQELPVNYLAMEDVSLDATRAFFKQLVDVAIEDFECGPLTPRYLQEVSQVIEDMQTDCEGCCRSWRILGINFVRGGFEFDFSAKIGGDEDKIHINFKAERTFMKMAGI